MNNEGKKERIIEDYIAKTTEPVLYNGHLMQGDDKCEAPRKHLQISVNKLYDIYFYSEDGKRLKNDLFINGNKCKVNFPAQLTNEQGVCNENSEQYYNRILKMKIVKHEYEKYFPSLKKIAVKKILPKESNMCDNPIKYIKWVDIEFVNKKLYVTLNNKQFYIEYAESTKEHDTLKNILFRKSQQGLLIDTSERPFKIIDTSILDTLILYLTLQIKLSNKEIAIPEYIRQFNSISKFGDVLKNTLPKNEFIDFLIENHDINYPVVPVIELNNNNEEPSYIFTIKKDNSLLLIWENKTTGRATYLFKSNENQYKIILQNLYDFVRSGLLRKRSGIFDYENKLIEMGVKLNFVKKIVHNDFFDWKMNILYLNM